METNQDAVPFDTGVRNYYRAAVAQMVEDSGAAAETREAKRLAAIAIQVAIDKGEITAPEMSTQIMAQLGVADDKDGKRADRMLETLMYGQTHLTFDELLDTVVVLGLGFRKPWSQITWEDMESMDEVRYANVEKQQVAYNEWRPKFHLIRNALREDGVTIETILVDGPLMPDGREDPEAPVEG